MPQFSYDAIDSTGRLVQGRLDAATENELIVRLSTQGLRVQRIHGPGQAPAPLRQVQQPLTAPRPATPPVAQPVPRPTVPSASPVASPVVKPQLKLRPSSEADLYFFFLQLGNLLRSGIAATEALSTIAQRHRKPDQAAVIRYMSAQTAQGRSLADAMAEFDILFPPGAVGAVRAGEAGGYTWEACEMVAESANASLKLRRIAFWFSLMFWSSVLSLPLLGVAAQAIDRMVKAIDNGRVPIQELGNGLVQGLIGPWGWITTALCLVFFALNRWMRQPQFREMRHNVAMKAPMLKKRTNGENMAAFYAHLSRLGKAGISPYSAWKLASAAVPNKAFADKLSYLGSTMHENTRLSQVVYASPVFPQELGPLVENGELTGNLPQSLEQAAEVGRGQAQLAETGMKWRMGCWVGLLMLFFSSLFFAVPYRALYESLFKSISGDP